MKTPIYKSYEDLPLYLNAETISKALGIAISSAYELMQEKADVEAQLEHKMDRWVYLNDLAEKIEAQKQN